MKLYVRIFVLMLSILLTGQGAAAFQFIFRNLDLTHDQAVSSDVLNEKFKDNSNVKRFGLVNVGFGTSPNNVTGLKLPCNPEYGDASVRIEISTGDKTITKVKINGGYKDGYFTINGKEVDSDNSITPGTPLSVIDITFHRNPTSNDYWAYIANVTINTGESVISVPEELVITYFDYIRPASESVYVNHGQKLSAISQNANSLKVLFKGAEIAASSSSVVDFFPVSSGTYTITASNDNGETTPANYEVIVSDSYPAHGSIVSPVSEVIDGAYYLISGTASNDGCLSLNPAQIDYHTSISTSDQSFVLRDNDLIVKAVKDGDLWKLVTDEKGNGLCEVSGSPTIGVADPVEIESVEEGFYIKFNGKYLKSSGTKLVISDQLPSRPIILYTIKQIVNEYCATNISFETWIDGDFTYAVGNVEVQLPEEIPAGSYYLYCGGRKLAEFVGGEAKACLPALDGASLSIVCEENGFVRGISILKENAWEEFSSVSFIKEPFANYRLHFDEENKCVNVFIPLKAETYYSYSAKVECAAYPQAQIIMEDNVPVVYIPDYLTDFDISEKENVVYPSIDIDVTPLIYVAEPQIISRSNSYSIGHVSGMTTTQHFEFVASDLSSLDCIGIDPKTSTYYTIEGRRLFDEPTVPGLYIKSCGVTVSKVIIK